MPITSTFDFNERAVLAILSRLDTSLAGVITQINTARGNNTTPPIWIDPPVQTLAAPPTAGQLAGGFPIVAIADGDITLFDDVGWGAEGRYTLTVLAYVQDPDPVVLAWKLRRYAQAIATVVLYGRNMDDGGYGVTLKRIVPARRLAMTDPNGAQTGLMSFVGVMIDVLDEQNTP